MLELRAGIGWNLPRLKILELSLMKIPEIAMKTITSMSGTGSRLISRLAHLGYWRGRCMQRPYEKPLSCRGEACFALPKRGQFQLEKPVADDRTPPQRSVYFFGSHLEPRVLSSRAEPNS
jgi:hypothetical protein